VSNRRTAHSLILAAALLIGAGPYVVNAAKSPALQPNNAQRANVDMREVFEDSEAKQAADAKTAVYGRKLDQKFNELGQMPFLTPAELRDLSVLLIKDQPTESDTKKITDLRAESEKRSAENTALAQKKEADLTPADKNRMRELNGMRPAHAQTMVRVQALYQQQVNIENEKNEREGMAAVRGVVAKLAKDKGIAEVYDSSVLIVAPVDLTKEAIERTKKKP